MSDWTIKECPDCKALYENCSTCGGIGQIESREIYPKYPNEPKNCSHGDIEDGFCKLCGIYVDDIYEVNTAYDQNQPIGDTPSDYPAVGGEPIDARNGDDFFTVKKLQEDVTPKGKFNSVWKEIEEAWVEQEHPRGQPDNAGQFVSKGSSSSKKSAQTTKSKILKKYPELDSKFVSKQIEKSEKIRSEAKKSNQELQNNLQSIPNVQISGRVKEVESMVGKLARKPELYKDVEDLNDISGVRVMADNLGDVFKSINFIKDNYEIIEEKNNIDVDRDGYRSYHFIINDGGVKSEIQVRTINQNIWANYVHDTIYKPKNRKLQNYVKNNADLIQSYILGMSNYYYEKDNGNQTKRPDCPEEIQIELGCME